MDSKERVSISINHMEPDRVPYDLAGTTVTAITYTAYKHAMIFKNLSCAHKHPIIDPIQQIVTPVEENLIKLNIDTRRIGARRIPDYQPKNESREVFEHVTDFYGCEWKREPDKDLYFNQVSYPLEKYSVLSESVQHIPIPDWITYSKMLHQDLNIQLRSTNGYCCIADRNTAGFTENSLRIRGYEKWFMDTILDGRGVELLLERILEDKIRYWDILIDWAYARKCQDQIDIISECDDLGSQSSTIISPEDLRKMVIPRIKELFSHIKKRLPGVKFFFHSCGAIRELIPDLIDAGIDILNPVQYTASGMELKGLKKDFGKDLTFWGGGIDTQSILNSGTPEMIRDTIKENLDIMAPGGGFVFAPVHNIQDDVSPENFWAMWEALQDYGKY